MDGENKGKPYEQGVKNPIFGNTRIFTLEVETLSKKKSKKKIYQGETFSPQNLGSKNLGI